MPARSRLRLSLAASLVMIAPLIVNAASPCDAVAKLYSKCGAPFDYDGHAFYFKLSSGPRTALCDDGRKLDYYDRIDNMDVVSIFSIPYVVGDTPRPETRQNWDPGRLLQEDFMRAVYGNSESEARSHLVKVRFLNQSVMFSSQMGAAAALSRAGKQLDALAAQDAAAARFLAPFYSGKYALKGNTFVWRVVKGTKRLSNHSFGVAIDMLTNVGPQYWLWDEMKNHPKRAALGESAYRNVHFIPPGAPIFNQKVVDVMEANGFVWGGKWNHYDTMHFEYRPEYNAAAPVACANLLSTESFARPTADELTEMDQAHPADHD